MLINYNLYIKNHDRKNDHDVLNFTFGANYLLIFKLNKLLN